MRTRVNGVPLNTHSAAGSMDSSHSGDEPHASIYRLSFLNRLVDAFSIISGLQSLQNQHWRGHRSDFDVIIASRVCLIESKCVGDDNQSWRYSLDGVELNFRATFSGIIYQ